MEPRGVESVLSGHVDAILAVAQREAEAILADAERHAIRYLDESRRSADQVSSERIRQVSEATDELLDRVSVLTRQSEQLIASLGATGPQASADGRLLATQMAVAGSSRDQIAGRLRSELGIEDAAPILDQIGL